MRCAVRLYGRRWELVFWVVLPWRLECVYFSCAARLVGLLARAWCQGGHRRQVMVPGSRKNGAAALKPETAARWCGAWRSCARRGSRTSVSDACGRPRDSGGRRAASAARSVDLRARGAAPGAALFSPIHDRPRYGSATRPRDINIVSGTGLPRADGVPCAPRGSRPFARHASRRRTNDSL